VQPSLLSQYPQWYCFGKERPATWDGGLYYGFPAESDEPVVKVGTCAMHVGTSVNNVSQVHNTSVNNVSEVQNTSCMCLCVRCNAGQSLLACWLAGGLYCA
jgi:hypothetical protein